jgi:DNA mismatch repair protein MutS
MAKATTPMMQQYLRIKAAHPDPETILFFRLGDFYEMFFEDARVASTILDITLTTRNKNDPHPIPLCGIPYHAANGYIARLIAAGKKVAICEQVEDPKTAKGVVKRDVLRVVTPGAVLAPESLPAKDHNFLAAIAIAPGAFGLVIADISTGTLRATQLVSEAALRDELERLEPREVLLAEGVDFPLPSTGAVTRLPVAEFDPRHVPAVAGCDALRIHAPAALPALGALANYLTYTKLVGGDMAAQFAGVEWYRREDYLVIDDVTKRNLELCRTMAEGQRHGSLLWHLDRTHTAMGARLVRHWLCYPLQDIGEISARHDAIEQLLSDQAMQERCGLALRDVADLDRLVGRMVSQQCNARDLVGLRRSLEVVPALRAALEPGAGMLSGIAKDLDPCSDLVDVIAATLVDDPPVTVREGGLIGEGVDPELDALRAIRREGKGFIARLEVQERAATGISSLKIRFNRVFGYYIEVTHLHREKVPAHYHRKQTLTNAERFITDELKQYEEKVTTAEERIKAMEYDHFVALRNQLAESALRIKGVARQVATCDVLLALATVAQEGNYVRPMVVKAATTRIREGRHPVIERLLQGERFVPNDITIDASATDGAHRLLIITGPNMAGKSTIMRQVGLLTLLAHMGSFVPAAEATIGLTDRIFTRVGASDNLGKGQSTFMVEMAEAATILTEATEKSLILIDELGRGTSTYDGISIAWAVAEFLVQHVRARTLFATHYHELAALAEEEGGIGNVTMAVKEWNDQIIFLRSLVPGAANRSYGIQCAKLAGLPEAVTKRAEAVLADLESETLRDHHRRASATQTDATQIGLFQQVDPVATQLRSDLEALNPEHLTPLEALTILSKFRERLGM